MQHIGLDLGAVHCHVVILDHAGTTLERTAVHTKDVCSWLKAQPQSRVVMEACTQSPAVAQAAKHAGHQVRVIPGNLVRALGVGARGIKTDERDAKVLADSSVRNQELPSVHLRSGASQERKLLAARALLVRNRRSTATHIKTWLRARLLRIRGRAQSKYFAQAVRRVALSHEQGLPQHIELLLQSFEQLTEHIEQLNQEIQTLAKEDPVCRNLQSIPGVGPIVAAAFVAHVDEPGRFANAEHLASFVGLVPGEATTGGNIKRTSTIKAGPKHLKALLVQAAWVFMRARPHDPAVLWARRIADKRGKRIAAVALARKLATIMWAMWRHGTPYNPRLNNNSASTIAA